MAKSTTIEPGRRDSEAVLIQAFARLDGAALGLALGLLLGATILLLTLILVMQGGENVGANLSLLGQFFPGYTVTVPGSLLGFLYGFITGLIFGWLAAALHNLTLRIYLALVQLRENLSTITDYIDPDHTIPMK